MKIGQSFTQKHKPSKLRVKSPGDQMLGLYSPLHTFRGSKNLQSDGICRTDMETAMQELGDHAYVMNRHRS